jgi:predicted secreted protein
MKSLAIATLALAAFTASAQTIPPPQNVLQLSAGGTVEVTQDLISISLATTREGADAGGVQSQLKVAVDAALVELRKSADPGQMEIRTGAFSVYPRYTTGNKIAGWRGTAEVVLEGRDFARITQAAARVTTLSVGNIAFGLSREQRAKVETDAQAAAIERFKAKAAELARGFGFSGYTLREVAVNANDIGPVPRMRMMAQAAPTAEASSPVPVEAGKTTVTVTVSGSVQLK